MTKGDSQKAVAARRRLRILRAQRAWTEPVGCAPKPRPLPDFTITVRSRSGDRLQITATRWGRRLITNDGIKSARSISRGIEMLLRFAVP